MSQENVDKMRQGLDAFNRRDRAAWLALCDPEYETVPSNDWPEIEPIRGAGAAWDFYVEADEPWEGSPYEYVELIDAPNGKIVAHQRREMRGKASGAGVVYSYWVVVAFRNGKVLRIEWFTERAKALQAAGLTDQDARADS
jgi:ketosteroid isomerase-like protein